VETTPVVSWSLGPDQEALDLAGLRVGGQHPLAPNSGPACLLGTAHVGLNPQRAELVDP
jgi:hypothetical protein